MKLIFTLISIFTLTVTFSAQSVIITPKKTTYTRPKPRADFKKTFTVTYPKVKADTPALSRRIESAISYQRVLDLNVRDETRDVQWLEIADFEVIYNSRGLLCVNLFIEGSGAYPSSSARTVVVDLKRGVRIDTVSVFVKHRLLTDAIRKKQRSEIENAIDEIGKDPDRRDADPVSLFENTNFQAKDLEHFSIDDSGVTFIFDYGFPHVIQAWQPDGRFKFTWSEIAQFVKPNSPFSKFLVK